MNKIINLIKSHCLKYILEISIFLGTVFISSILTYFTSMRFPNDDQFILYRYVENIVNGHGFVYNIGEHVLASTTPLFTLISSFFKYLLPFLSVPTVVAGLNIIFLSLSSVFFYKVSRFFISNKFSLIATFLFAISMAKTIPEGMETPLFLLMLFSFIYTIFSKKYITSSVLLSLTILTRPDAGLIAVIAFIYWVCLLGWKQAFKLTGICILMAMPWLVFSTLYFGSPIPQSLTTKLNADSMLNIERTLALKVQTSNMSRIYWGKLFDPDNILLQIIFNLIPFLILSLVAVWKKINKENWILFVIPIVYFISFSISNPIMYPWYISQMEPLWILVSFIGLISLLNYIKNNFIKIIIVLIILIGPVVSWVKITTTLNQGSKISLFKAAQYINENKKEEDTVGLGNIGIVGYITKLHLIDFYGLVSPDSLRFYPIIDDCKEEKKLYVIPPEIIKYTKPNWIVAGVEMQGCFMDSGWMQKNYDNAYEYNGLIVWHLK